MKFINENGNLILFPEGRIDSTNAPIFEAESDAIVNENPHNTLILDVGNLEYLSSAGLRVVLRLRKMDADLVVANASPDVYEIFEMTGFTEMMTIKKAYRKISTEGCEIIGQGANGSIYRIDRDTIVKVYLNPDSLSDIERERALAKKAFILGVPTAMSYDVARVGEGYGSVFELLDAKPLAKLIDTDNENILKYVHMSVDLLKIIHATEVKPEDMPDMKEVVLDWAKFDANYLPEQEGKKLIALVEAVPTVHKMLHGDYHVKNVMLQNGEPLLIDMDTLCQGHPIFEFASIFNAYKGFYTYKTHEIYDFLGIDENSADIVWNKTLEFYFGTEDREKLAEIENKASLIGYTRLLRRTIRRNALESDEGRKEVEIYKNKIIELLAKVNTLLF